jgi:hypothetical protein
MNRRKVITEDITFKEFRRIKAGAPPPSAQKVIAKIEEKPDEITLEEIIKFSKDKKNVRSDRKRKRLTQDMFIEYLDINYNKDDF